MANATSITLNALTAETVLTRPTGDVLDTGTDAVTIDLTPDADLHRILLEVTNTAGAADTMTVSIAAGDYPPAASQSLGAVSFTVAQSAVRYIVLDSAQHMQSDGTVEVTVTPAATKTQTATIRAYKLPK
jgi:hypothetical protein